MTEDTGPEIDGCALLFRVCKELQRSHLDHRETELLFDVEPGTLPAPVCHSLASLLRNVVSELAESELSTSLNGVVGVTLRRRGTACMVVLSDRGLRDYDAQPQFDIKSVAASAARLNGNYQIRARSDSRTITVIFEIHAQILRSVVERPAPVTARSISSWH
jgi:hypothetical protein